jgi:hypothetical protein
VLRPSKTVVERLPWLATGTRTTQGKLVKDDDLWLVGNRVPGGCTLSNWVDLVD